jgi:hypothetical protein
MIFASTFLRERRETTHMHLHKKRINKCNATTATSHARPGGLVRRAAAAAACYTRRHTHVAAAIFILHHDIRGYSYKSRGRGAAKATHQGTGIVPADAKSNQ